MSVCTQPSLSWMHAWLADCTVSVHTLAVLPGLLWLHLACTQAVHSRNATLSAVKSMGTHKTAQRVRTRTPTSHIYPHSLIDFDSCHRSLCTIRCMYDFKGIAQWTQVLYPVVVLLIYSHIMMQDSLFWLSVCIHWLPLEAWVTSDAFNCLLHKWNVGGWQCG